MPELSESLKSTSRSGSKSTSKSSKPKASYQKTPVLDSCTSSKSKKWKKQTPNNAPPSTRLDKDHDALRPEPSQDTSEPISLPSDDDAVGTRAKPSFSAISPSLEWTHDLLLEQLQPPPPSSTSSSSPFPPHTVLCQALRPSPRSFVLLDHGTTKIPSLSTLSLLFLQFLSGATVNQTRCNPHLLSPTLPQ